jgi:hypothetical protein
MRLAQVCISILACAAFSTSACGSTDQPEAPPPPFGDQPPLPRPLAPAERETKVVPLDSSTCGATDALLVDVTTAEVLVRCDRHTPMTRVLLTVVPRTTDPADYPRALSLRFCGDVIGAEAPAGWEVQIEREKGRDSVAADVRWELLPTQPHPAAFAAGRLAGFAVSLRGDWRRGMGYWVGFRESGQGGGISPHDCPYPYR